ncbi:coiled-coil-helix-coiled-coil-helix domain-containing protein 1 isoform X1 [Perognathus longimembris pacificus]|uniref:coiled-coil-helix-coiled-coil-helix domain-containing protein 1 isoform X1 n=1 Tax=Perognathus longimembris pacificus TaxID=214514 RepID=UPI002018B06D|nr:coiled-coil-helix-coiled-coil-helix domain-containing protein 1 isoform X1 [Perognathus longimembris pacificus]
MAAPSLRGRLVRIGNPRKPVLKPNKPLILANRVGERRREKGEATCITEMSVMMACWKKNEFRDEACGKEIQDFLDCASRAQILDVLHFLICLVCTKTFYLAVEVHYTDTLRMWKSTCVQSFLPSSELSEYVFCA